MKGWRYLACSVALCTSIGASSASAANWDPVGTELTATQEGNGTVTTNNGSTISCGSSDMRLAATAGQPDLMTTTHGVTNPVTFANCTALGFPVTMTTFGTWEFTATSTTSVDFSATPVTAGGPIWTWSIPALGCHVAINGPVTIPNNTWNNVAATLTMNNAASVPIVVTPESCATTLGTSITLSTRFVMSGASIT